MSVYVVSPTPINTGGHRLRQSAPHNLFKDHTLKAQLAARWVPVHRPLRRPSWHLKTFTESGFPQLRREQFGWKPASAFQPPEFP
jgi:hypothetical protein